MVNWKEYEINGVSFTLMLNTKRHVWQVYFGTLSESPDLEFTMAKGEAIIKFLYELERVQKERSKG